MARWVLHVDLDQFLAAVEVLRRPELAGLPVVVGGDGDTSKRGVVSTASYEARAFGVHSGMPLRTAVRKAPDAVFLPVDKPVYEAASAEVMATLKEFDAIVEVIGWDEAFMGVLTDDPEDVARRVKARVLEATQLSCGVGIGKNKLQAKTATGFGKPGGIVRITGETWFERMGHRPPDAIWGIGSKTAKKLAEMGISTVQALASTDDSVLAARFGPTIGPWIGRAGRGQDPSPVIGDPYVAKSRSREVTFQSNLTEWTSIRDSCAEVARQVAADIAEDGRLIGRVGVKIRWVPFLTFTSAKKLPRPTVDPDEIADAALAVLEVLGERRTADTWPDGTPRDRHVRLLGVRAEFA